MSCHDENEMFEPGMNIYHGSNCDCYEHENCCGCCKTPAYQTCDICEQQMKYIIAQLITLYPTSTFVFTMKDGTTITGTPRSITDACNRGLLAVTINGGTTYVNICNIAYVSIAGATYSSSILYMPSPYCTSCRGCQESVRDFFTVGQVVSITIAGDTISTATVLAVSSGVVALSTSASLIFASICEIDSIVPTAEA